LGPAKGSLSEPRSALGEDLLRHPEASEWIRARFQPARDGDERQVFGFMGDRESRLGGSSPVLRPPGEGGGGEGEERQTDP